MDLMFYGEERLKSVFKEVLPLKTSPERYDEISKKLKEKEVKKEKKKN